MGDTRRSARLDSLTSLRFFAAALVLLHHAFYLLAPNSVFATLSSTGYVGVGFFFMLSGFVLMWSYNPELPRRYFYGRRLARIYPLHIFTAVLAAGLVLAQGAGIPPAQAVLNLVLLQSWVPVESFGSSLNGVSWSLCCETFFYLLFPLVAPVVARWPRVAALWAIGVVMVVVAVATVVALPDAVAQQFLYKGPAYRVGGFIVGIMLAAAIKRGYRVRISVPAAVLFCCIGYAFALAVSRLDVSLGLPDLRIYADLLTLPASYVLIGAAARSDLRQSGTFLTSPWLVRLGEASFALYMVHFLILQAWIAVFGVPDSLLVSLVVVVLLSGVSVAASLAAYRYVEHPAERFLRSCIGTPKLVEAPAFR